MKNTTTTTTSRFDHFLYGLSDEELIRKVTNRVLTYQNKGKSSVKVDGERKLKPTKVVEVGHNKISGRRYIRVDVNDIDDGGKNKPRTLEVGRITNVKGKIRTALALAKKPFLG